MRLLVYCLSICVVGFNANAVQSAEDPSLQSAGLELRFVGTELSSLFSHKAVTDDGETIYLSSQPILTVADVASVTVTISVCSGLNPVSTSSILYASTFGL